jgi:hypothetical protein
VQTDLQVQNGWHHADSQTGIASMRQVIDEPDN